MAVQWKTEEYTVNGNKTQVLSAGQGEPVMFWHGAGTAGGWDFLAPLTEKFKVYLPIHPGFGGSADDHQHCQYPGPCHALPGAAGSVEARQVQRHRPFDGRLDRRAVRDASMPTG